MFPPSSQYNPFFKAPPNQFEGRVRRLRLGLGFWISDTDDRIVLGVSHSGKFIGWRLQRVTNVRGSVQIVEYIIISLQERGPISLYRLEAERLIGLWVGFGRLEAGRLLGLEAGPRITPRLPLF